MASDADVRVMITRTCEVCEGNGTRPYRGVCNVCDGERRVSREISLADFAQMLAPELAKIFANAFIWGIEHPGNAAVVARELDRIAKEQQ